MKILIYAIILCIFSVGFVYAEENTTEVIANEENATEQIVLFEGNITLPDGNVTVNSSQGNNYEIPAVTPMGAILTAASDANLSVVISDKPMEHKGILALDGINEYTYSANNTWFVVVNDYQLQEYVIPETDGMNIYTVKPGDKIGFYYGLPIKPTSEAQAAVLLTIE